jgi:hypothetical protein
MSGAMPPLPQYAFMAWCLVEAQGQLYLYLQYPEIFVPLGQTLFLVTAMSRSEPNQGERMGCSISVIDFWARNYLTESAL